MNSVFVLVIALALSVIPPVRGADALLRQERTVDGVVREALVYAPSTGKTEATPVVFVFHGHGNRWRNDLSRPSGRRWL